LLRADKHNGAYASNARSIQCNEIALGSHLVGERFEDFHIQFPINFC
jgi:hypothetical protein